MNIIEYLIQQNKTKITTSIYQNTIYKDKTLCEYLGVKAISKKPGREFAELLSEMVYSLPSFNYRAFMRDMKKYRRHKNQYLLFGYKLIKIQDIFNLIERYKDSKYFPISVSSPTFSSRTYKMLMLNKETDDRIVEYYTIDEYKKSFGDILHSNYQEILENEMVKDYKDLLF